MCLTMKASNVGLVFKLTLCIVIYNFREYLGTSKTFLFFVNE